MKSAWAARVLVAGCVVFSGCASAPPRAVSTRLVQPAQWPAVVDCVMISARASELWAERDSSGVTASPGLTPLAQQRNAGRAGVVGTVRVASVPTADGLRVSTQAMNWDAPAAGRASAEPPSATRAVMRQLDAQCLSAFPSVAGDE